MKIVKMFFGTLLIWSSCVASQALADTSSPSCDPAGPVTFLSGSGIRIEVDGELGGCNATGDQYSYGNVIGEVRVYSGFPGVTGAQSIGLLFDGPLVFKRIVSPVGGTILVGQWITRRGYKVLLTALRTGFSSSTGFTGLSVNEFFVYEPDQEPLVDSAYYQEWNTQWNTAMPTRLAGVIEELTNSSLRPIENAEISLFHCRAQDGLIDTQLTDSQGQFSFSLKEDGYYQMRVTPPEGFKTPPDPGFPGFLVYANGFTPCRDFRVTPEGRGARRTGGLFGRTAETPIRLSLERDE